LPDAIGNALHPTHFVSGLQGRSDASHSY
jgi:hypothetical protein